jgi:hypothetical protein
VRELRGARDQQLRERLIGVARRHRLGAREHDLELPGHPLPALVPRERLAPLVVEVLRQAGQGARHVTELAHRHGGQVLQHLARAQPADGVVEHLQRLGDEPPQPAGRADDQQDRQHHEHGLADGLHLQSLALVVDRGVPVTRGLGDGVQVGDAVGVEEHLALAQQPGDPALGVDGVDRRARAAHLERPGHPLVLPRLLLQQHLDRAARDLRVLHELERQDRALRLAQGEALAVGLQELVLTRGDPGPQGGLLVEHALVVDPQLAGQLGRVLDVRLGHAQRVGRGRGHHDQQQAQHRDVRRAAAPEQAHQAHARARRRGGRRRVGPLGGGAGAGMGHLPPIGGPRPGLSTERARHAAWRR